MRRWVVLLAVIAFVGTGLPLLAQGPVNPREPSGGSGASRPAVPRGSAPEGRPGGGGSSGAQPAPPPSTAGAGRTAVPRTGPPPDRDNCGRNDDRTVVVVPGGNRGARYLYRGRYYPFYPYGTTSVFRGRPYWYPPHYDIVVRRYERPRSGRYGELRLQVRPRSAEVYVDGYYAGRVDDFDGFFQGLRLTTAPHHIQIIAPGYEVLEFDVRPSPRGKITYEGDLVRF